MSANIIRINEDTWRIEDDGVRLFLLAGKERALLIDTGMNLNNARDIAEGLTDLPVALLNTHADRDHIGGNEQFEAFYMHPADEPLYRRQGKPGRIIPVQEGDAIDLGQRELRILHLPGHTPGSIAVLDVRDRVLISGDPVQEHGRVFMFGDHRSMRDYVASLERLEGLADQFDEIWPSHADIPVSPEVIGRLRAGAQAILEGAVEGRDVEFFGQRIVAYDLGFCTLLCDRNAAKRGRGTRLRVEDMKWTREPLEYAVGADRIEITTAPHTDLWQRTYYHFRNDNAPALQLETDEKFFSFVVKTDFTQSRHRFDQCGIVMYLDSENWLKGSVEYENGEFQHLGSVVTNHGYSDWATTAIPADVKTMWYRLSRREDDYCIECSPDGERFTQMRVCHMWEGAGTIRFGVYACSPEDSSFKAVFTDMQLTECAWKAHDGQQPD